MLGTTARSVRLATGAIRQSFVLVKRHGHRATETRAYGIFAQIASAISWVPTAVGSSRSGFMS